MAEHRVVAKVVKQEGVCHANHKVGQEFDFGTTTPANFCCQAFGAIWPTINMLMNGGSYSWDREPGKSYWACPDTKNPVLFQLKRVQDSSGK